MDFEAYRRAYFVDPPPEPRYAFTGAFGATLSFGTELMIVAHEPDHRAPGRQRPRRR